MIHLVSEDCWILDPFRGLFWMFADPLNENIADLMILIFRSLWWTRNWRY